MIFNGFVAECQIFCIFAVSVLARFGRTASRLRLQTALKRYRSRHFDAIFVLYIVFIASLFLPVLAYIFLSPSMIWANISAMVVWLTMRRTVELSSSVTSRIFIDLPGWETIM